MDTYIHGECVSALKAGRPYETQIDGGSLRVEPCAGLFRFVVKDPGGLHFAAMSEWDAADIVQRQAREKNYAPHARAARFVSWLRLQNQPLYQEAEAIAIAARPARLRAIAEADALPPAKHDLSDLLDLAVAA